MTKFAGLFLAAVFCAREGSAVDNKNGFSPDALFGVSSPRLLPPDKSFRNRDDRHLAHTHWPVSFAPVGQRIGDAARFVAAGEGYRLSLLAQEARLELIAPDSAPLHLTGRGTTLHLGMPGANPGARITGLDPLPGRTYYFEGKDSRQFRNPVNNYSRVRYKDIYPGVDLVFYANESQLEYDFVVAPGASLDPVRLDVTGADHIRLDAGGDLILSTPHGEVRLQKPFMYQMEGTKRQEVTGQFRLEGRRISFSVENYDTSLPLIVDPILSYATYVGRSVSDRVNGVAVAADGSTYLAGVAPKMNSTGQDEAFVAHISADGRTLLYMAYLGGSDATEARAIALDSLGNVYVAGQTKAVDFPVLNAVQPACGLNSSRACAGDAFVAKLNPDGSLNFATYLGGGAEDAANGIALDAVGDIYIAGFTDSTEFPVFRGVQVSPGGQGDGFVAKISGDGTRVVYATYLGGSGRDEALGIAVDKDFSAYVTGGTQSSDFITRNPLQAVCGAKIGWPCQGTAFVSKLSPDGSSLVYSTYLGGSSGDTGTAIAVDASGGAYVAGSTLSDDFPLTSPLQAQSRGQSEAFVTKLLPDGSGLVYSTFLGGSGDDFATSLAVDPQGNAFVAGRTNSADFPMQGPVQAECYKDTSGLCSQDAFVAVLNSSGGGLRFASYLGGRGADQGKGIAVDHKGSVYLGGATTSADFPLAQPLPLLPGSSAPPGGGLQPRARVLSGIESGRALASGPSGGGVLAVLSNPLAQQACSGSINWTGLAGDNQWTSVNNWDTHLLPVAADTVCIGTAFEANTITIGNIASASNRTIASLVSNANITFTLGPLTVGGGATLVNNLTISGGTLTLGGTNGSLVGGAMTLNNAILAGTDTLTITGLLTWTSGGDMCTAPACTAPAGPLGITSANGGITATGSVLLQGRVLNSSGTATFNNGNGSPLDLYFGSVINNSGTWSLTADSMIRSLTGGGTFNNSGTFSKTGGTGTSTIGVTFNNTNAVQANTGFFSFAAVGNSSGSWSAAASAELDLAAGSGLTAALSGPISGAGKVQFGPGTNNLTAAGSYNVTGGTGSFGGITNFNGTVTNVGPVTTTAGTLNFLTPLANNPGVVSISGGSIVNFSTGNAITVPSMTLGNGVLAGTDTVNITGLLTWGSSGDMCTLPACTAPGVPLGITNANGGITATGTNFLQGRVLNSPGTASFNNTNGFTLDLYFGSVINNSGTWSLTADSLIRSLTGGGTFNNSGTLSKTGGTGTSTIGVTVNNSNTVQANTGFFSFAAVGNSSGSWSAAASAELDLAAGSGLTAALSGPISGAGKVQFGPGTNNLTAAGSYNVTGGTGSFGGITNFNGAVTNVGPVTTTAGTLNFLTPVANNPGVVSISGGSVVNFSTGNAITVPSMTLSNGVLAGTDTVNITGLLTWGSSGGMCTLPACTAPGVPLGITNANGGITATGSNFLQGRVLNNPGTATFNNGNGSPVDLYFGSVINNSGTWSLTADSLIRSLTGGGTFNNSGTFSKTGGTGTSTIGVTFNNTNAVQANTGFFSFAAVGNSSGSWSAAASAELDLAAGSGLTAALSGPISGAGKVQFGPGTNNLTAAGSYNVTGGTGSFGGITNFNGTVTNVGPVTTTAGTLNFLTPLANNPGVVSISGGSIVNFSTGNAITVPSMTLGNGVLAGTDTVNITGLLTWGSSGDMCTLPACTAPGVPLGITNANGGITATGTNFLQGRVLNSPGTASFNNTNGFTLDLYFGSVINNSGTWSLTADSLIRSLTGGGTFNNSGTLSKTGGTGTSTIGVTFNNTNAVQANTGFFNFATVGNSSGSWSAAASAELDLAAGSGLTAALSGPISGAGKVQFGPGTNNLTAAGSYNVTGGTGSFGGITNFNGTVTNVGPVTTTAGTLNFLTPLANNPGVVSISGGSIVNFSTGNAITVPSMTLGNGVLAGTDTVNITGLLTWGSSGDMCTLPACTAPGVPLGITNANGGITATGTNFLQGRVLNSPGTASFNNTNGFTLDLYFGSVINNSGTWSLTADSLIRSLTGGGTFNNSGTFSKTGGTGTSTIGVTFNNTNAVQANTGFFNFATVGNSSGSWSAAASAELDLAAGSGLTAALSGPISGAGKVQFGPGTNNLTAAGSYNVTGGTGSFGGITNFNGTVTNVGPVTTTAGTLNFLTPLANNPGVVSISGGSIVNFSTGNAITVPSMTLGNGVLAGTDTVNITGLLTWGSSGDMCTLPACTAPGLPLGITNANGGITATGTNFLQGRVLNSPGTASFNNTNGFTLDLYFGSVINNSGTWSLTADSLIRSLTGGGTFNNSGTFSKTGGTGTSTIGVAFNNSGSFQANSGTLSLSGGFTQTAGNTFLGGGSISSNSPLAIQGGSVTGAGTITSSVSNTGGTMAPGVTTPTPAIGVLTLAGTGAAYTQGLAGAYNVKFGGTAAGQFDRFTLPGAATLNGTLNASLINGYTPALSDSLTILTAGSVTGTFASTNLPVLSSGLGWHVTYNPTNVVLSVVSVSAPVVTLGANSISFPNTIVTQPSAVRKVTLQNTGTAPLTITSIQPTGLDAGNYSYVPDSTNPCPISPATLGISAICNIDVVFTPTSAGTHNNAQITITDNDGNVAGSTQTISLSGTGIVLSSIAVTAPLGTINKGATEQFTATGTYSDSSTANLTSQVTWNSSSTATATISATGLATAVDVGSTNVTASLNGVTSNTFILTVANPLTSISITAPNSSIAKGATDQFTATGTYADNSTANITGQVTWHTSMPAVATISATGLATGVGLGTSNITASLGTVTSNTFVLTVTAASLVSIDITAPNSSIAKGTTEQFTATGTFTDNSTSNITSSVTWSSSVPGVATVSSTGLATAVATGTSNITASLNAITSNTFVLTVTAATLQSIAVTPANPTIAKGATQQFTATGTYSDNSTQNLTAQVTWASATPATATITSGGLATGAGTGTSTISATLGAKSGSTVLTVTAAALQSIAVTPANPTIAKGATQQFTATGTYSDNSTQNLTGQVTWASATPATATITAAGLATGTGVGTSTISATLGAVSGSTVLTVTAATLQSIAVTPANPTVAKGATQQFTATGTYSDNSTQNLTGQVTWASATPATATITAAGLATGTGLGTSTISATLGAVSGSTVLTVTAATLQSIAVTPANPTIAKGATQQFTATGTYSDNSTQNLTGQVTWASATPATATITAGGLATGAGVGTSTISATLGAKSGSTVLTVTAATLQSIAVTPANPSIPKGTTQQFAATGTYSDNSTQNLTGQVTWASATPATATITNGGLATGAGTGTSTISATLGAVSGSTVLTVTAATLQSIAVTPANPTVAKGATQQFTATGTYSDNSTQNLTGQVTWASATTSVATITSVGLATGAGTGTSTISATLGAKSGSTVLTVTAAALQSIAVTPANPTIAKGATQQFTATGTYSDNSTQNLTGQVTWASATPATATITAAGLATGTGVGTSTISATLGAVSGSTVLTVTAATLQSIAVTPANPTVAKGATQQFTATGTYSDNSTQNLTGQVTWASATPATATITSVGLATGAGTGTSTISATLGAKSGSTVLTVTAATLQSIAVTPANPTIAKGATQQFTATGTYSDNSTQNLTGQVTWASATPATATITAAGLATGTGVGTSTISATLGAVSGSTVLTVTAATLQSIAVTPANPTIAKGATQQFTATGTYSDNSTQNLTGQVTWASATPATATITSVGLATGAGTGTSTISATLGAKSGSTVLTVTAATLQSIAVTPANPSIPKGTTQQFTATGTYSDNSTQNLTGQVTWASATPATATITNGGLATGAGTGTSTISATLGAVSGSTVLTVTAATLQSIAVTPANPSVAKGATQQFTATGTYSDNSTQNLTGQVTWASATTSVATITSVGLATGAGTGTSTISATLGAKSGSTVLTVTAAALQSIAVTPANPTIAKGATQQFTATGTYSDNSTQNLTAQVTWASATPTTATITAAGLATGAGVGTSTISATLGAVSGSTVLTVTAATLQSIAVTPANPTIAKGATQQFTATGTYSDNSTQNLTGQVTWASATPATATITAGGLATGAGVGTSTISATLGAVSGSTVLTVTAAALQSIAVTPANPSIAKGATQQFTATGTYSDDSTQNLTGQVTWASATTSVATITAGGLASGVGVGTTNISATLGAVSGSTVLTVTAANLQSIAVTPANPSIPKGTTQQFAATGTYSDNSTQNLTGQVTWASATTSVATITASLATGVGTGTTNISATLGAVSGSTVLTVTAATLQSINISAPNGSVVNGTSEQFTATGSYSDGSTANITNGVTWNSATPAVATISTTGLAIATGTGTTNITASLSGVTSNTFVLTVTPAAPAAVTNVTSTAGDGIYGTSAVIPISVAYTKAVIVTGTPLLALNSGGAAAYSSGSGTGNLVFLYSVAAGQNSSHLDYASSSALVLNGGSITDATSTPALLILPAPGTAGSLGANKNIVIDTMAPTVVSYLVRFGSQSYSLGGSTRNRLPWQITGIQVVFSKPIVSGNVNSLGGVTPTALSGLGTNILTWAIAPLSIGNFATTLAGSGPNALIDGAGNPLGGGSGFAQTLRVLWGDMNDDGVVNAPDLTGVFNGTVTPYNIFGDLNGDGVVNTTDLQIVRTRLGTVLP